MIRLGYRLSYNALPSRKNSGLNRSFVFAYFLRISPVNPTGTVDFITITARGLTSDARAITSSTESVLK